MVIIKKTWENNVGKDVEKMQPLCTVGKDINWFSRYGKQYSGSSKKLKIELPCEIKPVTPEGNQSWIFIARTDAETETPTLWPPDGKSRFTGKDLDAGKDWRQEEKGMTEGEMVGWHHWLDGYEFEQASGIGDGQGSLACCSPWGLKESDTTDRIEWSSNPTSGFIHTKEIKWLSWRYMSTPMFTAAL